MEKILENKRDFGVHIVKAIDYVDYILSTRDEDEYPLSAAKVRVVTRESLLVDASTSAGSNASSLYGD